MSSSLLALLVVRLSGDDEARSVAEQRVEAHGLLLAAYHDGRYLADVVVQQGAGRLGLPTRSRPRLPCRASPAPPPIMRAFASGSAIIPASFARTSQCSSVRSALQGGLQVEIAVGLLRLVRCTGL